MRVLLADDQNEVRKALRLLLEQEQDLSVVGEVGEAVSLLDLMELVEPDLLLLDWELPGFHITDSSANPVQDTLEILRALRPSLIIVALSGRPEARTAALAAGANAFVSKGDPPDHLLTTLRAFDGNGRT